MRKPPNPSVRGARYHSAGVHVADIGSDTGRVDDIVEVEHGHERVHLHEQRQRLSDPARGAQDRDLEPRRAALGAAHRGPQRGRARAFLHLRALGVQVRGDAGEAVGGGVGVGLHGGS